MMETEIGVVCFEDGVRGCQPRKTQVGHEKLKNAGEEILSSKPPAGTSPSTSLR